MRRLPFQKGYVGNWSEETFLVRAQMHTVPVTYRLTDLTGEDIKGTFYSDELQFVVKPHDTLYVVERILTRSPAIAEGPRDAGVPVEIW